MRMIRNALVSIAGLLSLAVFAGCTGPFAAEDLTVAGGNLLSAEDLLHLAHELAPGEVREIHVSELDVSAREAFADVVDAAIRSDGVIRIESGGDSGVLSRGTRVCRMSLVRTEHVPGCRGGVTREFSYTQVYGLCPHPGYVSTNRGLVVKYTCTKSNCTYRAQYMYEYHKPE